MIGRLTVVMNKDDYYEKCNELLKYEKTYQKLESDLIDKVKKEFLSNLKDLKDRKVIDHALHMKLNPMVTSLRVFFGLP